MRDGSFLPEYFFAEQISWPLREIYELICVWNRMNKVIKMMKTTFFSMDNFAFCISVKYNVERRKLQVLTNMRRGERNA